MYEHWRTSLNQIPAVFKKVPWKLGDSNLDIGGGRFNTATKWLLNNHGVVNYIFDPFCRSESHNKLSLSWEQHDTATLANVLCVIPDSQIIVSTLELAKKHVKDGGKIYISVYEGNRTDIGAKTSINTWQNNRKLKSYDYEVGLVFKDYVIKNGYIEVTNDPKI